MAIQRISLVTGAASGIGKAVANALRIRGDRVIAADIAGGDIVADLASPHGRRDLVRGAEAMAPQGLDLVVACAGVAGVAPELIVAVNYFGALATLDGLRALLAKRPGSSAIAIASSAAILPVEPAVVEACLSGEEDAAKARASGVDRSRVYASSKRALALWMRRSAITPEWAGRKIFLNAIAPGTITTPMTASLLATHEGRERLRAAAPIAVDSYAGPDAIAEVVVALSGLKAGYVLGQVLFVDGGAEAISRTDTV